MPDLHKIQLNFTQMQKIINICGVHKIINIWGVQLYIKKIRQRKTKPFNVINCK